MLRRDVYLIENSQCFRFDGQTLRRHEGPVPEKEYCGTFLPLDHLTSFSLQLPISTDEESFDIAVEIAFVEEGGLEREKNYKIAYTRTRTVDELFWHVEAFAVEEERLRDTFLPLMRGRESLDLIAVPFLRYEALYAAQILPPERAALFFRLSADECYAAFYLQGRFLSFRLLPSLKTLAKRLRIDLAVLETLLYEKGLTLENRSDEELELVHSLRSLFVDILDRVGSALRHRGPQFGIREIDRIWLDARAPIPGLWELFDQQGFPLARKELLRLPERFSDNRQAMLDAQYVWLAAQEQLPQLPNLTIFVRRAPFYKTRSGRFILVTGAAALLILVEGLWQMHILDREKAQSQKVQRELNRAEEAQKLAMKKAKEAKEKRQKTFRDLQSAEKRIYAWKEIAVQMGRIKENAQLRRMLSRDVDEALAHYGLMATRIEENTPNAMSVQILVPYDQRDRIAKFMLQVKEKGYRSVGTDLIQLEKDLYQSLVKVTR